jgi:NitT/TauT family transport system substrate-binding protein
MTRAGRAAPLAAPVPESGPFRMSMQPWLGYALWYVARDRGLFEKNGLSRVDLIEYSEDSSNIAIVAGGSVEATSTGLQGVLQLRQHDEGLRVVMLEDESTTADCIIAPASITSVSGLKGRSVAFEVGSTSHLLIADALEKAGLSLSSITPVNVPAAQAAAALTARRVDAAVTYEPYVSAALQLRPDVRRLYTAADSPGLISDCLLVTGKTLATRPGQVAAMIRSWGDAQQLYVQKTDECQRIMAKGLGADLDTLRSAFAGVHLYSIANSKALLHGAYAKDVLPRINDLCLELKLTTQRVDAATALAVAPIDAV